MKTLQLIVIAIAVVFMIIGTNVVFAEKQLNNAILMPFKDNELVVVGKVVTVNRTASENKTQYSIAVEKYLKNPKSFDLLTATGYGIRKEIADQFQQRYFNQAIFEKGDRVFLYLHQKGGQYVISPFSFLISRGDVIHPPDSATIRPGKNNYYGNDDITILGAIDKGYMYTSSAEYGSNSTVSIVVSNPNHEKYLIDQVDVKPDGSFIYQFKIKGKLGITGTYESDINIGSGGYGVTFDYIANPLMQFKSGIVSKDVKCKESLVLITKASDNSPACVTSKTIQKLIERGWAIPTTDASKPWVKIDTPGLNDTYSVDQPISFSVTVKGFGNYPCVSPQIKIHDNKNPNVPVFQDNGSTMSCPALKTADNYSFDFPGNDSHYVIILNKTGDYIMTISYGDNSVQKYFSVVLPSNQASLTILENNAGIVSLKNQTYYFETPNYTNDAYIHPVQVSFHDVLFTLFPPGFRGGLPSGCGSDTTGELVVGGGRYYWADAKFSDGIHELLHIFADSQPCPIYPKQTMFSNHTNPQAGLTFYDGKMKLLVKTVTPIGKNIVLQKPSSMVKPFPRCNPNPTLEKLIREKQQVLTDALLSEEKKYGGFENRTQNLPWSFIGYDCVDNALEVGILPQYFNSDSLPKYFEKIRSIVGNTIDIVLSPEEYALPV